MSPCGTFPAGRGVDLGTVLLPVLPSPQLLPPLLWIGSVTRVALIEWALKQLELLGIKSTA